MGQAAQREEALTGGLLLHPAGVRMGAQPSRSHVPLPASPLARGNPPQERTEFAAIVRLKVSRLSGNVQKP